MSEYNFWKDDLRMLAWGLVVGFLIGCLFYVLALEGYTLW
jgi:hypothetical protein